MELQLVICISGSKESSILVVLRKAKFSI